MHFYLAAPMTDIPGTTPPNRNFRPHFRWGIAGNLLFSFCFFRELLLRIPAFWMARGALRKARAAAGSGYRVVCVSDNLDEVNGIALASRTQLRELRRQGREAWLFGVAFHTRKPRREGVDDACVLAPGVISIDQAGYTQSENAVVSLKGFLEFLREHPVDLIEFETPGTVSTLCMFAAKAAGIPTLSHYRTDIITYSEVLMKGRLGILGVQIWTRYFTRHAGPVIVPSEAYREKVAAMGVPVSRVHKLPRGVDLTAFHPDHRGTAIWYRLGIPNDGFKLLYVGRVSEEKNLEALCTAFTEALDRKPDLRLVVTGEGPYLDAMRRRLEPTGRAHFTGVLHDQDLAEAFASADLFVFPSVADTFGNSVVEALASGLPCLVSDEGGPREIVLQGHCGEIFLHKEPGSLREGILAMAEDPDRLARYRDAARRRAAAFSYEASANAFWNLYTEILKKR
jgi:glycosyltransferase involved in cell wall biosynthesis